MKKRTHLFSKLHSILSVSLCTNVAKLISEKNLSSVTTNLQISIDVHKNCTAWVSICILDFRSVIVKGGGTWDIGTSAAGFGSGRDQATDEDN